jgi:GNAT superfamily N-acetyltransferase
MAADLDFRHVRVDSGDGAALVAAMTAEMRLLYDGLDLDAPDMPKAGATELGPPGGTYLVGYRGECAICGGGIKRSPASGRCPQPDGACEIKRMYVVPAARGQGVARVLLHALEDAARELGYRVARPDTGPRQPNARGLYESEGYRAIANFNANPVATCFGEKLLRD